MQQACYVQEHVYYQSIQDDTPDVLAELLKLEGAVQRYNPRLLAKPSPTDRYSSRPQIAAGVDGCSLLCPHGAGSPRHYTCLRLVTWLCVWLLGTVCNEFRV